MFINKQHPARAFRWRRGRFWHISFSRQSFHKKNCDTLSFQRKSQMTRRTFICQCHLWDAPYLFSPCLTSSSSFFRIHRNWITYNFIPNMTWMLDFCEKMNEFSFLIAWFFPFTLKSSNFKRTDRIILEISNELTSLLHPKVKLHNFFEIIFLIILQILHASFV